MYKFKIRCSQIGQIMGAGRSGLPVKCKTYVKKWLISKLFDRQEAIHSKYMDKGNECEDESIESLAHWYQLPLVKNEEYREDEYLTGTCDVIYNDTVYDIKNSWSCFTFPLLDSDVKNKDYWWQLQGYMELWGVDKAKLVYTLNNLPPELLDKEIYYESKRLNVPPVDIESKIKEYHSYDNVDEWKKIKIFDINKDKEAIAKVKDRVEECQKYVDELMKKLDEKEKF